MSRFVAGLFRAKPRDPAPEPEKPAPQAEPEFAGNSEVSRSKPPSRKKRRAADWLKPYQFPPGTSGNPGGRRKGQSIKAILAEVLERCDDKGQSAAERLGEVMVNLALDGNPKLVREVLDRTYGKVVAQLVIDHNLKGYVTESPDTLWPSDPNSAPTSPEGPPASSGATPEAKSSSPDPPVPGSPGPA